MLNRRGLFSGVVGLMAMPAVVRAENLMKIKPIRLRKFVSHADMPKAYADMPKAYADMLKAYVSLPFIVAINSYGDLYWSDGAIEYINNNYENALNCSFASNKGA